MDPNRIPGTESGAENISNNSLPATERPDVKPLTPEEIAERKKQEEADSKRIEDLKEELGAKEGEVEKYTVVEDPKKVYGNTEDLLVEEIYNRPLKMPEGFDADANERKIFAAVEDQVNKLKDLIDKYNESGGDFNKTYKETGDIDGVTGDAEEDALRGITTILENFKINGKVFDVTKLYDLRYHDKESIANDLATKLEEYKKANLS
jgi:hypothetical protein